MRILVLMSLLLMLCSFALAQQKTSLATTENGKDSFTIPDRNSWADLVGKYRLSHRDFANPQPENREWALDDQQGEVCYTMRSYLVARVAKHSDETEVVSSSTCQPGSKFGMRTTLRVAPVSDR
jgi:hypothetical protein